MSNNKRAMDIALPTEIFENWRSPRYGDNNPTSLNNPLWESLIRSRISAYAAREHFNGDYNGTPVWCFDRYGQSKTALPDGRMVLIAGEHEDFYDPDFCIYNDVVVIHPDQSIQIFGYPQAAFPPTDFHTATLVDNWIVIIGNLGYSTERVSGHTPVYVLNLDDFSIQPIESSGQMPGWIHEHQAVLSEDGKAIVLTKGLLYRGADQTLLENIDDWRLDVADWSWTRLTKRSWSRWECLRKDREEHHLWEMRHTYWYYEVNWQEDYRQSLERLECELGFIPPLEIASTLYQPAIAHEPQAEVEDEHSVFRIKIDGVIVRYDESDWHSVKVTVEGELLLPVIDLLQQDLLAKLTKLSQTEWDILML